MSIVSDFKLSDATERDFLGQHGYNLADDYDPLLAPVGAALDRFEQKTLEIAASDDSPARKARDRETLTTDVLKALDEPPTVQAMDARLGDLDARLEAATAAAFSLRDEELAVVVDALKTMDTAQARGLYLMGTARERFALEEAARRIGRVPRTLPDGQVTWANTFDSTDAVIAEARRAVREEAAPALFAERERAARLLRSIRSRYATARTLVARAR